MGRSQPRGHSAKLHYRDGGASRGTRLFWASGGGASQRRCSLKQGANNLKSGQRSCQGPEALWAAGSLEFNSTGMGEGLGKLKEFCALRRAVCPHFVVPLC